MEYWIRRGDSEYSYDIPDEARGMELLPGLPRPGGVEEKVQGLRRLTEQGPCVLVDYFPAAGAYAKVLDVIQAGVSSIYLNAWRCGEGMEERAILELRRAGSRSGIEPIGEAERTRLGEVDLLSEPLRAGRLLFVYPSLPDSIFGREEPAASLLLALTFNQGLREERREEILGRVGRIDYVGLVLSPSGELLDIALNDPSASHRYRVGIQGGADCVVVSAGGDPFDRNLYQSLHAALLAGGAVRDGGIIILSAECGEGIGSKRMVKAAYEATKGASHEERSDPYTLSFTRLRELRRRATLCLVSALPRSYASLFGLRLFDSTQEAVQYAVRARGRELTLYSIPHGLFTLPVIEGGTS